MYQLGAIHLFFRAFNWIEIKRTNVHKSPLLFTTDGQQRERKRYTAKWIDIFLSALLRDVCTHTFSFSWEYNKSSCVQSRFSYILSLNLYLLHSSQTRERFFLLWHICFLFSFSCTILCNFVTKEEINFNETDGWTTVVIKKRCYTSDTYPACRWWCVNDDRRTKKNSLSLFSFSCFRQSRQALTVPFKTLQCISNNNLSFNFDIDVLDCIRIAWLFFQQWSSTLEKGH